MWPRQVSGKKGLSRAESRGAFVPSEVTAANLTNCLYGSHMQALFAPFVAWNMAPLNQLWGLNDWNGRNLCLYRHQSKTSRNDISYIETEVLRDDPVWLWTTDRDWDCLSYQKKRVFSLFERIKTHYLLLRQLILSPVYCQCMIE